MQLSRRARRCRDVAGRERESEAKTALPLLSARHFCKTKHLGRTRTPRRWKIRSAMLLNEAGKFTPDASLFNSQKPRR